ncbi:MAG: TolC family protein, partial [Gemmatimonadota bacterium]
MRMGRMGRWGPAAGLAATLVLLAAGSSRAQEAPGGREAERAAPEPAGRSGARVSLEEAVAAALRNNRQLRLSHLELEKANKQVGEAFGGLFPDIDADLSYQRNVLLPKAFLPAIIFDPNASPDDLIPVQFGADNQWSAGVSVSQPLFDAGVFIGVGTAARFRSLQAEATRGEAQQVGSAVRRAYFDVLLARERVRVTENSVARVESTLEETKAMNRAGLASDYDVLRLEVQLANLRPNLRRNRNALAASERTLALEMGLGEDRRVAVAGELHSVDLEAGADNTAANRDLLRFVGYRGALDTPVEELRATALRMRSDVRQARLDRELRTARVGFERCHTCDRPGRGE